MQKNRLNFNSPMKLFEESNAMNTTGATLPFLQLKMQDSMRLYGRGDNAMDPRMLSKPGSSLQSKRNVEMDSSPITRFSMLTRSEVNIPGPSKMPLEGKLSQNSRDTLITLNFISW
jgi:hypothetical protein